MDSGLGVLVGVYGPVEATQDSPARNCSKLLVSLLASYEDCEIVNRTSLAYAKRDKL